MKSTRRTLVALAAVALTASVAAPANADKARFTDKAGDLKGGFDVRSATVKNNGAWIKIRTKHKNLKRGAKAPAGGVSAYIDIAKKRKGPEVRFAGPVGFDGGYSLQRVRGWKTYGSEPNCKLRYKVNYKRDAVRFAVPRRCLSKMWDRPIGKVRVAVKASQNRKQAGKPKTDWLPKKRKLTRAVAR